MAGATQRERLDQVLRLLEEIADDNTAVVAGISEIRAAQEATVAAAQAAASAAAQAAAADAAREVSLLRADLSGTLVHRALKDLCTELVGPLAAMDAMLEQADFSDPQTVAGHVRGLSVTLRNVLARMGAERIAVAVGKELFDPVHHRCAGVCAPLTSPFPDAPPRTVVRVVEAGYVLGGRLIRPAVVEIQSGRESTADQAVHTDQAIR